MSEHQYQYIMTKDIIAKGSFVGPGEYAARIGLEPPTQAAIVSDCAKDTEGEKKGESEAGVVEEAEAKAPKSETFKLNGGANEYGEEWEIRTNKECSDWGGVIPCPHSFGHGIDMHGHKTWLCPRVVAVETTEDYAYMCLDYILEAAQTLPATNKGAR